MTTPPIRIDAFQRRMLSAMVVRQYRIAMARQFRRANDNATEYATDYIPPTAGDTAESTKRRNER